MCSASSDPSQHDVPVTPAPPRRYVLSGDKPEPRGSVALAVLGEMLTEAEDYENGIPDQSRVNAIQEARQRVAEAEAAL